MQGKVIKGRPDGRGWLSILLKLLGFMAVGAATLFLFLIKDTEVYLRDFVLVCMLYLVGICLIAIPKKFYKDFSVQLFLALLAIPPVISLTILLAGHFNLRMGSLSTAEWSGLFGGLLTYFGAGTLALVMFRQNQKVEESNQNYQKLSVIPYISFITVTYLSCKQVPPEVFDFEKGNFQGQQIEFFCSGGEPKKYFLIDFTARNSSDYPIMALRAKCSFCAGAITDFQSSVSVYFTEHQTDSVRVVIPINEAEENRWNGNNEAFIALDIYATNVLEFTTKGTIIVHFVEQKQAGITYRVAQISETNPFLKGE